MAADPGPRLAIHRGYDWGRILRVSLPNLCIAVGAGLTIPFVNLFFNSVFQLEYRGYGVLGALTGVLVLVGSLANPFIKRRFGYGVAILVSQSLAVFFLVLMAMTELIAPELPEIRWLAFFCFLVRQPLMNMAGPITSDLALSYVGERNREIVSAIGSSLWSGSWFLSAKIFKVLRDQELEYWQIFCITAVLYSFGIFLYSSLIRAHARQASI